MSLVLRCFLVLIVCTHFVLSVAPRPPRTKIRVTTSVGPIRGRQVLHVLPTPPKHITPPLPRRIVSSSSRHRPRHVYGGGAASSSRGHLSKPSLSDCAKQGKWKPIIGPIGHHESVEVGAPTYHYHHQEESPPFHQHNEENFRGHQEGFNVPENSHESPIQEEGSYGSSEQNEGSSGQGGGSYGSSEHGEGSSEQNEGSSGQGGGSYGSSGHGEGSYGPSEQNGGSSGQGSYGYSGQDEGSYGPPKQEEGSNEAPKQEEEAPFGYAGFNGGDYFRAEGDVNSEQQLAGEKPSWSGDVGSSSEYGFDNSPPPWWSNNNVDEYYLNKGPQYPVPSGGDGISSSGGGQGGSGEGQAPTHDKNSREYAVHEQVDDIPPPKPKVMGGAQLPFNVVPSSTPKPPPPPPPSPVEFPDYPYKPNFFRRRRRQKPGVPVTKIIIKHID